MFWETSFSGLGATSGATMPVVNPGAPTIWQQLGYSSKDAWRADGKPQPAGSSGDGSMFTPPPGAPTIGPGGTTTTPGGAPSGAGGAPTGAPSGGGGFLSGIPSTYLLIGGAIILVMMLKK